MEGTDYAEKYEVTNKDAARRLVTAAIETYDLKSLEPYVAAMMTEANKAALSAMAVSGDEPDLLDQFLVLCETKGLLSTKECDQLSDAWLEVERTRAA